MLFCLYAIAHGVVGEAPGPCAGKRLDGPAVDVLRGAHLKVLELEWSPFAYKDPAARHGWSGYDIDLFSEVAHPRLHFRNQRNEHDARRDVQPVFTPHSGHG